MKKIILLFLFNFCAHAETIYCPPQIICEHANDLASCTFEQHPQLYWDKISSKQNSVGTYKNTYVSAPYYSYDQGYAMCVYTHENSGKTLTLRAKPESNLEASMDDHTGWHTEETWWECAPTKTPYCPLQEQAVLMVKNSTNTVLTLSNDMSIQSGQFMRLYQQDILKGFVDIYMGSNYVGRIYVDLKNRLKLIDIVQSSADLAEIDRIEEFNAVVVDSPT